MSLGRSQLQQTQMAHLVQSLLLSRWLVMMRVDQRRSSNLCILRGNHYTGDTLGQTVMKMKSAGWPFQGGVTALRGPCERQSQCWKSHGIWSRRASVRQLWRSVMKPSVSNPTALGLAPGPLHTDLSLINEWKEPTIRSYHSRYFTLRPVSCLSLPISKFARHYSGLSMFSGITSAEFHRWVNHSAMPTFSSQDAVRPQMLSIV